MSSYGDFRARDAYMQDMFQAKRASNVSQTVHVDQIMYGLTAATGSAIGDSSPFQLVNCSAVQTTADDRTGRFDILINDGTGATANIKVAELSSSNAKFVASNLSGDFGSSYTATFNKGTAQDNVTASTNLTLATGSGGTAVALKASSDRLYVSAANTDLSGDLTVEGNDVKFYQTNSSDVKVADAGASYSYVHGDGTNSTNAMNLHVDAQNVTGAQMASGEIAMTTFSSAGAAQKVLSVTGGAAAGAQSFNISNANVGVGTAASTAYKVDISGKLRCSNDFVCNSNVQIDGDLLVSGNTVTVNVGEISVEDRNIVLANNTSDISLANGGGITLSTSASAPTFTWDYPLLSWESNYNVNAIAGMSYFIDGGANTTANTGMSLSAGGISWGADTAAITLGTAVAIDQSKLEFTDPNSKIYFGPSSSPTAVITKDGLSGGDTFSAYFGGNKQWRITREIIDTLDVLSFSYSTNGLDVSPVYVTKFSIAA